MDSSGPRRILRPAMYLVLAVMAHAFLLLLPIGGEGGKASGRMRGVRVKAISGGGSGAAVGSGGKSVGHSESRTEGRNSVPAEPADRSRANSAGGGTAATDREAAGADAGGALRSVGDGTGTDRGDRSAAASPGGDEYRTYLDKLRSNSVQGWARESAGRSRQGWSGNAKPSDVLEIGRGDVKGTGAPPAGGYLDPRVRMVVTSYPATGIERRYTQVPYPNLKFKQHQVTSGWWNVYVRIATDKDGKVVQRSVLRPETDGPMERLFVTQVQKEIDRWSFDPAEAEILVDVRFHVE